LGMSTRETSNVYGRQKIKPLKYNVSVV